MVRRCRAPGRSAAGGHLDSVAVRGGHLRSVALRGGHLDSVAVGGGHLRSVAVPGGGRQRCCERVARVELGGRACIELSTLTISLAEQPCSANDQIANGELQLAPVQALEPRLPIRRFLGVVRRNDPRSASFGGRFQNPVGILLRLRFHVR